MATGTSTSRRSHLRLFPHFVRCATGVRPSTGLVLSGDRLDTGTDRMQCWHTRGPAAGEPAADSSAQTMFIKSHQSTMIFVMIVITFTINSYDAL